MRTFIENTNYLVSENGEIYSKQLLGFQSEPKLRQLKPSTHKTGYLYVTLSNGNKHLRKIFVHRMVAITYIPNPDNKPVVNHIDGNKQNNNVDNLEWVTIQENTLHARDVLGCKFNSNIKQIYQYDLNGEFIKRFDSLSDVSNEFKKDMNDIRRVCNGDRGRLYAYGYIWSYELRKYTDDELEKIHKSFKNNNNRASKIYQYSLCGDLMNIYESLNDVISKNPNMARSSVSKACTKHREYKGYKWSYGEM